MISPDPSLPPTSPSTSPFFAVTLPVYDWHRLLDVLEGNLHVVNRNQTNAILLFEAIATQLNGKSVSVIHEQNPDPTRRPKKPVPPQPAPSSSPAVCDTPASLWKRMFSLNV